MKEWYDKDEQELFYSLEQRPRPLNEADQRAYENLSVGRRYTGFIAEDVDSNGGSRFVMHGKDGLIEGIEESRFVGAQVQVLIRQMQEVRERLGL